MASFIAAATAEAVTPVSVAIWACSCPGLLITGHRPGVIHTSGPSSSLLELLVS
jgi:hypothetical protein